MADKRAPGRSLDKWMELVTECRQNGLTDAAWCNEHGISPSCFYNAVTRLWSYVKKKYKLNVTFFHIQQQGVSLMHSLLYLVDIVSRTDLETNIRNGCECARYCKKFLCIQRSIDKHAYNYIS